MKKLFSAVILGMLVMAGTAQAAQRDISGTYVGEGGTITIRKADAKLVRVKPEFQDRYNMAHKGEFGATPERLAGSKHFTDTGKKMEDAYLVSFDMGKNRDCPLTWQDKVGQFDGSYINHRDIDPVDDDVFFTIVVNGDLIDLSMPMIWVRAHDSNCISSEIFFKKQ